MYKWIRPSIIKYPTIWRTFTNKISLHRKEYWIQDITPEYRDQVIKFTLQSFLHDEPLTKLINVPYETRIQEFMNIWKEILNQRSSVICLTKDGNSNPILCGINYTVVLSKTDKDYSSVDTNFDRFLTTIKFIQENGKLFEKLNINEYLYSFGLYVLPEYRGDSIGENLLAARENMCKAFGLKATAACYKLLGLYFHKILIMSAWKRPESVPFPTVWAKFEGKIVRNGIKNIYWIQEVTDEYKSQVLQYMMDEFTLDEPFCKYSKISEDPDVMKQFKEFWWESFKENLALVCLTKDQNGVTHVAGMNCTLLGYKGDDDIVKNKLDEKGLHVFHTLKFVKDQVDPFKKFNITEYLDGMGLYVLPKYRGEGLGIELLRAREPMCRALGLKATLTLFTSKISQILAERVGFKDLYVAEYADLEKNPGLMKFPGIQEHTRAIRFMYLLYE
ncbi:hypothetical protein QE152_g13631 [Popillia japonica]|uniref:N-acetyltransferase domain-containing protein n=1 Tax=Popillia japonica TaxID=7064 RepID=A0AAW1LC05_POPJA